MIFEFLTKDKLSHVGMVIQSTTLDTMDKVIEHYGGTTWVKIEGKMLLGASNTHAVNSTGGSETHTLAAANLPSHNHSIPSLSGSTNSAGEHNHAYKDFWGCGDGTKKAVAYNSGGSGADSFNTMNSGAHSHSVTTNASTTGSTGNGTAINHMPPYKTVYIWERTA